jgi:hypothetical protein
MKKIIFILTATVLILTSCGATETAEVIATSAVSTTAISTVSTVKETTKEAKTEVFTNTTKSPVVTTTEVTTTEFSRDIYEVNFPIEFSDNYTNNIINQLSDEDYETEVSPEAEKLFDECFTFISEQIGAEKPDHPEYPTYYEDGRFHHYPAGYTTYGLVDINSDVCRRFLSISHIPTRLL